MWEIDQSLDPSNFAYTGQLVTNPSDARGCTTSSPTTPCMKPSTRLIPPPDAVITQAVIDHHQHVGYVEFIGEAVLDGMTHTIMNQLVNQTGNRGDGCTNVFNHQTKFFSGRGTNAWMWSNSDTANYDTTPQVPGTCDRGLSDVPNVLSGTAFVTIPGDSVGLAYNAEVFTNFRTATARAGIDTDIYVAGSNGGFPYNGATPATKSPVAVPTIFYAEGEHRIENYYRNSRLRFGNGGTAAPHPNERGATTINLQAEDSAVILHDETSGSGAGAGNSPRGDYVYEFESGCLVPGTGIEDDQLECRISFNNTWGPTLWDGDDYFLGAGLATFNGGRNVYGGNVPLNAISPIVGGTCSGVIGGVTVVWDNCDNFDQKSGSSGGTPVTSLAEVEEAIRIGGQNFFSYYFDGTPFDKSAQGGQATLTSYYFGFFPTKFFWFEHPTAFVSTDRITYMGRAVRNMLGTPKPLAVEVWDIFENSGGQSTEGCISPDPCGIRTGLALGHELNFFDIKFLKAPFNLGNVKGYENGRVVISPGGSSNDPLILGANLLTTFPGLFYTFEIDNNLTLGHWRSMNRGNNR
jgi:hypothetical protein